MAATIHFDGNSFAGIQVDATCEKCQTRFSYVHFYRGSHRTSFQTPDPKRDSRRIQEDIFPGFLSELEKKASAMRDKQIKRGFFGVRKCPSCGKLQSWMGAEKAQEKALLAAILVGVAALFTHIVFAGFLKKSAAAFDPTISVLIALPFAIVTYAIAKLSFRPKTIADGLAAKKPEPKQLGIYLQLRHHSLGIVGASIPVLNELQWKAGYGKVTDYLIESKVPAAAIKDGQWQCPLCGSRMSEGTNKCSQCRFAYLIK